MRSFLFSLAISCVFSFSIKAQKATATAIVTVSDFQNNLKQGEVILFQDVNSDALVQGITNAEGKFEIQLEGSTTYEIKIKGFSEDEDYSTIPIPEIRKGQRLTFNIDIQFEPAKSFTLDNVHFETGKASLKKESYAELLELVEYLELKENVQIEIAGHTDDIGEEKPNLILSQKRAETVRNYLISKGIKGTRLKAKGYGEMQPIAENSTEIGRQKNRRTEVRILE